MHKSSRKVWAGALTTGVIAVLGATIIAAPSAAAKGQAAPAEIKMVFADGPPLFEGAESIEAGEELKIINKTKPQEIGPHFFSLVEEGSLPTTKKKNKKCAKLELPVCVNIANAHRVSKRLVVRKRSVDKGADGWDTSFTKEVKGDSWFTDQKNESETRVVSPEVAGSTLHYFCLIHPDTMRGQIQVETLER